MDNRNLPHPKPVERIVLSKEHTKQKILVTALLLVIGLAALSYALYSYFAVPAGWQELSADSAAGVIGSDELVFLYELGSGETSAAEEKKALTALYTESLQTAYQLFNNDMEFDGVHNVRYLNRHPNETVEIDGLLYQAFALAQRYDSRYLYLAPVYAVYDNIFYCGDDSELVNFDPNLNAEISAEFAVLTAFAGNPEEVSLRLLGDNQVCLAVSEEYLRYAAENGIEDFVDFYWMKNAFIVDYLAERMLANGYCAGCISSYDGFIRNFDTRGTQYSFELYNRADGTVYQVDTMEYQGPRSIVYLRDYPMNGLDGRHYYELADGGQRMVYLDWRDGRCKSALSNLVSYSETLGCAEILLQTAPIYIAEDFQEEALEALAEEGIQSVYFQDGDVAYTQ
ncbi:MAG: hypothetical protein NC337_03365 [Roseburia sp.]|nr:hypothetical protein [Roseburia sp.]